MKGQPALSFTRLKWYEQRASWNKSALFLNNLSSLPKHCIESWIIADASLFMFLVGGLCLNFLRLWKCSYERVWWLRCRKCWNVCGDCIGETWFEGSWTAAVVHCAGCVWECTAVWAWNELIMVTKIHKQYLSQYMQFIGLLHTHFNHILQTSHWPISHHVSGGRILMGGHLSWWCVNSSGGSWTRTRSLLTLRLAHFNVGTIEWLTLSPENTVFSCRTWPDLFKLTSAQALLVICSIVIAMQVISGRWWFSSLCVEVYCCGKSNNLLRLRRHGQKSYDYAMLLVIAQQYSCNTESDAWSWNARLSRKSSSWVTRNSTRICCIQLKT
jgi:hypothetical protein